MCVSARPRAPAMSPRGAAGPSADHGRDRARAALGVRAARRRTLAMAARRLADQGVALLDYVQNPPALMQPSPLTPAQLARQIRLRLRAQLYDDSGDSPEGT